MEIFYEVFEGLPRHGPGEHAHTSKALALCRDLDSAPRILDLGCGVGAQTLDLAELTGGTLVAVDIHAPNIERLRATIEEKGLADRIEAQAADFNTLPYDPASFDLIWSEGALYNIGIARALEICHRLLRPRGYLAFTDAVWRTDDPPPEVRGMFEADYPTMGRADDVRAQIVDSGFLLEGHFTLPDSAWWTDFYTPMQLRVEQLRKKYSCDQEALDTLDEVAKEPEFHKQYGSNYAYEFFVCRRPK